MTGTGLGRLLAPSSIAVIGGAAAEGVITQCRRLGYEGTIWPVHLTRASICGLPTHSSVADLPGAPDAAFVGVSAEATVEVVAALAEIGCGAAVCHASGFAETGTAGRVLQDRLRDAAGTMPIIGPNCMGVIDYTSGAALWPDQQGGERIDGPGVAIVTQSGNIALNLTMQRQGLPVAAVMAAGNGAVTTLADLIGALVDNDGVTAVGVHLEEVPALPDLVVVARRAARAGKPVVVLRTGRSRQGARANSTHTGSLAGDDAVAAAVLRRCGFAEVEDLPTFLNALSLAHVVGSLPEASIVSASCSGGEAALVADLAEACAVRIPPLGEEDRARVASALGDRVTVDNPLDYHTYVWGDRAGLDRLFDAVMRTDVGLRVLVLDQPRADRCSGTSWETALAAWSRAARDHGAASAVLATMPEGLPPEVAARLVREGIAPLRGLRDALVAVRALADSVARQRDLLTRDVPTPLAPARPGKSTGPRVPSGGPVEHGNPAASRAPGAPVTVGPPSTDGYAWLRAVGVPCPNRLVAAIENAASASAAMRYPVAVKTAATVLHKSDIGGVVLDLHGPAEVDAAARAMTGLGPEVLVEEMVTTGVAEILVGVRRDPRHGIVVTVGAGGLTTELSADVVTLVAPVDGAELTAELGTLRIAPLLRGHRGRPAGDVPALVRAVLAMAAGLEATLDLREVEVNPVIVLPDGGGVVAVDVVLVPQSAPEEGSGAPGPMNGRTMPANPVHLVTESGGTTHG